jgi:serine/threonine protein kinase
VNTLPSLDDLLDQWEEARARGENLDLELLCQPAPELLEPLRAKIEVLKKMDARLQDDPDATALHSSLRRQQRGTEDRAAIIKERPQLQTGFENLRFHAQGGLGMVFEGTDVRLHRNVALKFMHGHLSEMPWARERFLLEAEITGRLDHPGIVPVHGLGMTETQRPFYTMRFIRGETYDLAIQRYHNPLTPQSASERSLEFRALIARFISVCNTLAYAHNCGIVHRDIKPENIMLGRYAETLVVDWGLALAVDRDETAKRSGEVTLMPSSGSQAGGSSGGPAGTPAYMAPEQARDCDHVNRHADIYSLGVVLYKVLCGQLPYKDAHSPLQLMELLQKGKFPHPSEIDPKIPKAVEAICLKAMSTQAVDRYDTALDMAADLEHWLADESVSVYQEPRLERATRWVKKHQHITFAIAGAVLIALFSSLASAIGLGTYAQTESALRANAESARLQNLRTATQLAASMVGQELNERLQLLERSALDPKLVEQLIKHETAADSTESDFFQNWLVKIGAEHKETLDFDTMFLVDAQGVQLARFPIENGKTIGQNFAHRDYFHGRNDDGETERTAKPKVIERPHLSTMYESSSDKSLKVALSVPIWNVEAGKPNRRVIGVLGMSIELNKFDNILNEKFFGNNVVELIDLRFDTLSGKPKRGLVLHHPVLQKKRFDHAPRLSDAQTQDFLLKGVARLWEIQQTARGNPPVAASPFNGPAPTEPICEIITDHVDPVDGTNTHSIAAFSTVWIANRASSNESGGKRAYLDTGWIVVVKSADPD